MPWHGDGNEVKAGIDLIGANIFVIDVLRDGEFRVVAINRCNEESMGLRHADLCGKRIEEILPPAKAAAVLEHYRHCVTAEQSIEFEEGFDLRTGHRLFRTRLVPVRHPEGAVVRLLGTSHDITATRAMEDRTQRTEAVFRAIFDHTFQFIGLLSPDGTLVQVNQAALQFAGLTETEVIGKPFWTAPWWQLSGETARRLEAAVGEAAAGRFVRYEVAVQGAHGQPAVIDFSLKPVRGDDGTIRWLIAEGRDITETVQERAARLDEASRRAAAESASQAKSEILARISHELLNPLNAIKGFTELLEVAADRPPRRDHIGYLKEATNHLLGLLEDLLDLGQVEARTLSVRPEPLDARSLLPGLAAAFAPAAAKADLDLEVIAGPDPVTAIADPLRLRQVLDNLMSNAIKYNRPQGRLSLSVEGRPEGTVRFTVADTGIGIPDSASQSLFQPFNRLGRERSGIPGTGVGLSLAKRLVEAMGGTIGFADTPGGGSTFWIDLPSANRTRPADGGSPDDPGPG